MRRQIEERLPTGSPRFAGSIGDDLQGFFDAAAAHHDEWRRRHHVYYREQTNLLRHLIDPGQKVLEVGCATGDTLAALSPSEGVGLDLSPRMVAQAKRKHPEFRFLVGNCEEMDFGGESFDVVLLADLVGEARDLWATVRALRGVVHAKTRIVFTYYNFLWQPAVELGQWLGVKRPQPLQNWFSLHDMRGLLELNGFETVTTGGRLLAPLPFPGLTQIANRCLAPLPGFAKLTLLQYLVARPGPAFETPEHSLSVSVVVPAKNERGNVRPAIRRTPRMGTATEIIFVEGGSTDGTREEILAAMNTEPTECQVRFVAQTGRGKGDAVRSGFEAATGDVLMILDADLTVMPEDLPRFFLAIAERRAELINGSRLVYQMEDQAMRLLNLAANKLFGMAFSHVLGQPVKDTLCGTKVLLRSDYHRIAAQRHLFGELDPFGDFDLLFGAARLGLRIVDLPVRYRARTYGATQIHRFRHGFMLLHMLWRAERYFKAAR